MEHSPLIFPALFSVLFFGIVVFIVYRIVKYGGFSSALYGATVVETIGEIEGRSQKLVASKLKVQFLQNKDAGTYEVGLEIIHKTFASWQMTPIALEKAEAEKLYELLGRVLARAG